MSGIVICPDVFCCRCASLKTLQEPLSLDVHLHGQVAWDSQQLVLMQNEMEETMSTATTIVTTTTTTTTATTTTTTTTTTNDNNNNKT